MLHKFLITSQPWQKFLFKAAGFVLTCIFTLGLLMSITAFLIVNIDTPEYVLIPLTTVLLTSSAFIDGFLLAKIFRENGLIIGMITGLIFTITVIVLAIYKGTFAFTSLLFTKIAAILLAGMLGGILGVNT